MKNKQKMSKSSIKNNFFRSSLIKTVYFGGTFEILNYGHVKAFELAKTFGNYLIIGLNSDKLIRSYKHREPVIPYYQKKFMIESFKWVDKVIPVTHFSPMSILKEYDIDVYVVGYEFLTDTPHKEAIAFMKSKGGEVRVMPDFHAVRTSQIKEILLREAQKQG